MTTKAQQLQYGSDKIRKLILTNDDFLNKSVLFLYEYQTFDEKRSKSTREKNLVGFNKPDGYPLSDYTDYLLDNKEINKRQIEDVRERMLKYSKQLFYLDIDSKNYKIIYDKLRKKREERKREKAKRIELETMTIEELINLDWSKPKKITTRDGRRLILKTVDKFQTKRFWNLWNKEKEEVKKIGISPKNDYYTGKWILNWWKEDNTPILPKQEKIVIKSLKTDKLFGYQQEHTLKIMNSLINNNVALDSSDTGTGKTYSALCACYELGLKPLIICPKAVIPSWERALKHFNMKALVVVNYELLKTGKMIHKRPKKNGNGYIRENIDCPYLEVIKNEKKENKYSPKYLMKWKLPEKSIVIFDEAHRCKNKNTINTQMLLEAKNQNLKILMLSATISENPLKMYTVGYALGFYEKPYYFYRWAENYGCYKTVVNRYTGVMAWVFDNNDIHIKNLHNIIFPKFGSRMKIINIPEFPETQIEAQTYNMNSNSSKIEKIYKEMKKELKELDKMEEKIDLIPLSVRQKARQRIELLKVPTLVELTQDYIESGNSVVIFVNFTQTLKSLCEKLQTNCSIYGGNNGNLNEENRKNFQNDKERIIICNVKAAREGIDLHDVNGKYPRVSLLSPCDSAQNLKQCLGRVHRIGGKSKSIQRIIYCANSIEDEVCDNVQSKINNISMLNDGDLSFEKLF